MTRRNRFRGREGQRGAVLVFIALGLPMLMAAVGVVVDLGQLFVVRAKLQATADATALAAAPELPDGTNVRTVAHQYADLNYPNYGEVVATEDVELGHWDRTERTFHPEGSGGYPEGSEPNAVRVTANRTADRDNAVRLFFGAFLGKSQSDVRASAVAWMSEGGLPGIFAGGTNCPNSDNDDAALMWDADRVTVFGDVHSNGYIWVDGDHNSIPEGKMTHVTGTTIKSPNDFPTPIQVGIEEFPLAYPDGHFDPGHQNFAFTDNPAFNFHSGNVTFTSTPTDGIHVAQGNITIDRDGMTGNFTFVSLTGRIKVHGDGKNLTAYHDDLLFYAPRQGHGVSCSEPSDIRLEDDDNHFHGVVLAPKGRIWVDGDDDWELNGAMIGWAITLEGDDLTFRVNPEGVARRLQLLQ